MKNIVFIIFCLAQTSLHCMYQLGFYSNPGLPSQAMPIMKSFGFEEFSGTYFLPTAIPRAGYRPFLEQIQIPPAPEAKTLGTKRNRSITPPPEQKKETTKAKRSKKLTPKELAKRAVKHAEKHYKYINQGPNKLSKAIKANAITGLSSNQVEKLQEHHKSFLEKQTEVKRLLSDESCWKDGNFRCSHKKLGGESCSSSATRRSAALIHIEGGDHLQTGAYFCIPCLLAGKIYINPQPQNVLAHIKNKKKHDLEHVESGVGILSAMDGYKLNDPEDAPIEPEAQQQTPADKQNDIQVSPYRVSDTPQPNAPIQPDTQRVQIEAHTLKVDACIQTEQIHEIATQNDDPPEHEESPPQKKRRIEDPAALLDKKRTEHSQATKLCTFFYNLKSAWPNSTTFVCPCRISKDARCGLEIKEHEHKQNFRQAVLNHLSTAHFNRKRYYCSICLDSGTWVAGSNKEVIEHTKFLHGNDTSCVQILSTEKISNTLNHRVNDIQAD